MMDKVQERSRGGILNRLVGEPKNDGDQDARTVGSAMVWALAIGALFAICWRPHYWAVACLWGDACALVGMLLGFLFGIPRFLTRPGAIVSQSSSSSQPQVGSSGGQPPVQQPAPPGNAGGGGQPPVQQPVPPGNAGGGDGQPPLQQLAAPPDNAGGGGQPPVQQPVPPGNAGGGDGQPPLQQLAAPPGNVGGDGQPPVQQLAPPPRNAGGGGQPPVQQLAPLGSINTNLEEISDWLTKIIVGVSLVEMQKAQTTLQEAAAFIAQSLGGPSETSFAYGLMIYFSVSGFLGSYLLTRLYLQIAFRNAASRS
jgi:hypothetical protein